MSNEKEEKQPLQPEQRPMSNDEAQVIVFCHQITSGLANIGVNVENSIRNLHQTIGLLVQERDLLKKENDRLNVELNLLTKKKK